MVGKGIRIEGLRKRYGEGDTAVDALKNVDMHVEPGEVVGLIFDGNVHSLIGDVAYDSTNARAIAVDSRGMLDSFAKVYNATELVQELQNTK